MNFMNFLTCGASLFNLNLQSNAKNFQKENRILIPPVDPASQTFHGLQVTEKSGKIFEGSGAGSVEKKPEELQQLVLKQEQMIINQYLQLSYLTQQLQAKQEADSGSQKPVESREKEERSRVCRPKKIKKINKCGHEDKEHYAKGMCNNCYHKYGRTKKPWNCSHRKLYAAGMCQNCYINNYNRKKRADKNESGELSISAEEAAQPKEQEQVKIERSDSMSKNSA